MLRYTTYATNGTSYVSIKNPNDKPMKEQKLTRFNVEFEETKVTKHSYSILAENKADALKKISEGGFSSESEIVSVEVKEVK